MLWLVSGISAPFVLGWLLPTFIDIMMDNPDESWGDPFIP
jgi:hypothetical protein